MVIRSTCPVKGIFAEVVPGVKTILLFSHSLDFLLGSGLKRFGEVFKGLLGLFLNRAEVVVSSVVYPGFVTIVGCLKIESIFQVTIQTEISLTHSDPSR